MKVLVADSGPLIIFARTGNFGLLHRLAGQLIASATVYAECTRDLQRPGAKALIQAKASGQLQVLPDPGPLDHLTALGAGERTALALAAQLSHPLLLDDRLARQAAEALGLPTLGSFGILLAAKKLHLIKKIAPMIAVFEKEGYFVGKELKLEVLKKAGEGN